jgi:hypothetical protein
VQVLGDTGIEARTVASLLNEERPTVAVAGAPARELWIVDEAGLLSSKQANGLLERANEAGAKVVLVGDAKQHHAVEAGAPFAYLQRAGMETETLDKIRRQQDPELRAAVEKISEGRVKEGVRMLDEQKRVVEIADAKERHRAIAQEAVKAPDKTLVVAPSNAERHELNRMIREELIAKGQVERESVKAEIATSKQLTREQKADVRNYEPGDRVKYFRDSKEHGIERGTEGRVIAADAERHRLEVRLQDGRRVEYDPKNYRGGDVASVEERRFAAGDRVQFREPDRAQKIANGELGTIKRLDHESGAARIQLDKGHRGVDVNLKEKPVGLDHAYAVTSHSSQGKTVDRVLVTVNTEHSRELVNREQLYVSVSRARQDAVVYTNDRKELTAAVDREAGKSSAVDLIGKVRDEGQGSGLRAEHERGRAAEREGNAHGTADGRATTAGRSSTDERDRSRGDTSERQLARDGERGSRDAAQGPGRGEASRPGRDEQHGSAGREAASERGISRETGADARTSGAGDLRRSEPRVGGDGREVQEARGRGVESHHVAGEPHEGGHRSVDAGGHDDTRGAARGTDPARAGDAQQHAPEPDRGSAVRGGDGAGSPTRAASGPAREEGQDEIGRMVMRGEEHRSLGGMLPDDLKGDAVRLNVAARESGGESVITPDTVRALGEDGVRDVVTKSFGDPERAALLVAEKVADKAMDMTVRAPERAERERD